MTEDKRPKSEFNMAVSYLGRLNYLFCMCDDAAMNLQAYEWFHCLLTIYRELSTEMKDTEKAWCEAKRKKLLPNISKFLETYKVRGIMEVEPELYEDLHDFEMNLRQILKDAGLQLKMVDDPSASLGQGE